MYSSEHIKKSTLKTASRTARSTSSDRVLTVNSLTLFYGNRKAIDNVSFSVGLGEIVTILGPNGGGKTSLIRALVGINKDYLGSVVYKKDAVIAYMPQSFAINTLMPITVEYLLLSVCWGSNVTPDIQSVMRYVDVSGLLRRQVSELSAGEKKLVLMARCLIIKPNIIVLDEPVSCMDIEAKNNFYQLLGRLVSECSGISIIMTSHDLHCIMACSDRVICINRSVRCEGTPATIAEDAKFSSVFPDNV